MNFTAFKNAFDDVKFYLNENGKITCDEKYHKSISKLFIILNWDNFTKFMDPTELFKIVTQIPNDVKLRFNIDGELDGSIDAFNTIKRQSRRYVFITQIYNKKSLLFSIFAFFIVSIWVIVKLTKITLMSRLLDSVKVDTI